PKKTPASYKRCHSWWKLKMYFSSFSDIALQKFEQITFVSNLLKVLFVNKAILPVDCVGLPPDISIMKSFAFSAFDKLFFKINRCGAFTSPFPLSPLISAPLTQ